jgi:uncharacterized protein
MPVLLESLRPELKVGGTAQAPLSASLLSLMVREDTQGLYRCEASFGNWGDVGGSPGFLYFDGSTIDFGKDFEVTLSGVTLFKGRIYAIEAHYPEGGPPAITVLAEDKFQDLRMTRRSRMFEDMDDSAVFQQIASDHGLSAAIDVSGPTHKILAQVNQSDLSFLRERARAIDAELWVDDSGLHAKGRASRAGTAKRMTMGNQLREFSVIADLATQFTSVSCNGWEVASKQTIAEEATEAAIQGELNGGRSGAAILQQAFGVRKQAVSHTVPLTSAAAQADAAALFKRTARRFIVGHGVADPAMKVRVGDTLDLAGLGPSFSGKYYVGEARTLFDGRLGMRTEFTAERPALGQP